MICSLFSRTDRYHASRSHDTNIYNTVQYRVCVCVHISGDKVWMMLMNDLPAQSAVNSASAPGQETVLKLSYNVSTEQVLFFLRSETLLRLKKAKVNISRSF